MMMMTHKLLSLAPTYLLTAISRHLATTEPVPQSPQWNISIAELIVFIRNPYFLPVLLNFIWWHTFHQTTQARELLSTSVQQVQRTAPLTLQAGQGWRIKTTSRPCLLAEIGSCSVHSREDQAFCQDIRAPAKRGQAVSCYLGLASRESYWACFPYAAKSEARLSSHIQELGYPGRETHPCF